MRKPLWTQSYLIFHVKYFSFILHEPIFVFYKSLHWRATLSSNSVPNLTHWGRDKITAISQMTFSNAFSWMEMHEFHSRFHWSLFLRFQITIFNIPALVQIMAWRRPGDKPSSEPMIVSLLTHICITRPQWVNIRSSMSLCGILSAVLLYVVWSLKTFSNQKNDFKNIV